MPPPDNVTVIADLLQELLDAACSCLDNTTLGAPKDCFTYWCEPPDDCCFAAETQIVTSEGVHPIGSLAGQVVELMTTDGQWVKAPVHSFGAQRLHKVVLARSNETMEIFATGDHRWLLDSRVSHSEARSLVEATTAQLQLGDVLASETGEVYEGSMDPDAVCAGIVFGEGITESWDVEITVNGVTASLAEWFEQDGSETDGGLSDDGTTPPRLPLDWKAAPSPSYELPWLAGWLAGYIAADGLVSHRNGAVRLLSSNRGHLNRVREICYRLGIGTSTVAMEGYLNTKDTHTQIFSVSLNASTLRKDLLVRSDHRSRVREQKAITPRWRIVDVSDTTRVEEVFCASVPGTRAFVLDGGVLTGNCDYLAVYPVGIKPTIGFSDEIGDFNRATGRCNDITGRLDIRLKLMRECWPAPTQAGDTAALPPKSEMQTASEQLMVDMWVLWCCVLSEYSQGNFWSINGEQTGCIDVGWGEMVPKCPQGGCAGLYWDMSIELPNCC